uniref:Uncharacterized protein n=1 Tax=Anguilla anguilla TaxID=7936 RepID=A0A0E9QMM9_ANGAN
MICTVKISLYSHLNNQNQVSLVE